MALGLGRHWDITLEHMERVKWYAPHIRHVVLDIRCSAISAPAGSIAGHAKPANQIPGDRQGKMPRPHMQSPADSLACAAPPFCIPVLFASQV